MQTLLPFISSFPEKGPFALPVSFTESLRFVQLKTQHFLNNLTGIKMVTPFAINKGLIELHAYLASAHDFIFDEAKKFPVSLNPSFVSQQDEECDCFNIYDNYFGVARADDLPFAIFIHQYINIARLTIEDLTSSVISLKELTQLITGFNEMAKYLITIVDPTDKIAYRELPAVLSETTEYLSVAESAIVKWKVQHYAFNISMLFATETLTQAITSLMEGLFSRAADMIVLSSVLLRSSTSAMWTASSFTSEVYNGIVRPSMESTNAPGGFSGNQNREFETWRKVKDQFRDWLKANIDLTEPLSYSLRLWLDTYILDMMHHTLVADAMKVEGSLVDKDIEKKIGLKTERRAIDALQQLIEMRKKEFEFLFA